MDSYFTDRVTNFGDGSGGSNGSVNFKSRGRAIWAIDWSDFNVGIVATNSAKREYRGKVYADANSLFSCVITPNTKHYDLRSTTWTTQLGDAKRHVLIENFKPGGLRRFGLDYASVSARNPGLVYASINGFGSSERGAAIPGYDLMIQAMSGPLE